MITMTPEGKIPQPEEPPTPVVPDAPEAPAPDDPIPPRPDEPGNGDEDSSDVDGGPIEI
jgi:hypothetical protein